MDVWQNFSYSGGERAAALCCFERSDCSGGHRRDDELGGRRVLFHAVGFDEVIGGGVAPCLCLDLPDIISNDPWPPPERNSALRFALSWSCPIPISVGPASLATPLLIAFDWSRWRNRVSLPCGHPLPSRAILMSVIANQEQTDKNRLDWSVSSAGKCPQRVKNEAATSFGTPKARQLRDSSPYSE